MGEIQYGSDEIKEQCEKIEKKIKEIINKDEEKKSAIKDLQEVDVRDKVIKMVYNTDNREEYNNEYNQIKENDPQNVVAITALGKKWAKKIDYDYDASDWSTYIYCRTIFKRKKTKISKQKDKKDKESLYCHVISCGEHIFRGDTMNSWSTTLNEFMRRYGNDYINGYNGKYIPKDYRSWAEFLSEPTNYKKMLPMYIIEFMEIVYTMGNFIPVPKELESEDFNKERSSHTKDYWDLTLLEIYNYYMSEKKCSSWLEKYKAWFDDYGTGIGQKGWDSFVEKNYMKPFVNKIKNKNDGKYGMPYELWDGHFNGGMPKEQWQFEQFFVNAKVRILERGKLIANALIKELK